MAILPTKMKDNYSKEELEKLEADLADYWEKSRNRESESVSDLEKHLWLANGASATASIGFIQAKKLISCLQYVGAWAFIIGIVSLVALKFISTYQASRDRYRFQEARNNFDTNKRDSGVFNEIRDKKFHNLNRVYLFLQYAAGTLFIFGLIFTLIGITSAI